MDIHPMTDTDWPALWQILRSVLAGGDVFACDPHAPEEEARRFWITPTAEVFVAVRDGVVVGSYFLRPNQPGLGSHVANAGFLVDPGHSGRGVGRAMGEHCLAEARRLGYRAMQFNYVVSTNERAVRLWQSLGFDIIATVPGAFRHAALGPVPIHIMRREL